VLSELLFDTTFSQSLVQDLESNSYDIFLGRVKVILVAAKQSPHEEFACAFAYYTCLCNDRTFCT
jgi:hypothetical protein